MNLTTAYSTVPFTKMRSTPPMPCISPITSIDSTYTNECLRPTPIRVKSYSEMIAELSCSALNNEKDIVEKNLVEAGKKLEKIMKEEDRREEFSEKVSRLGFEELIEGLEAHHRTMKQIYRKERQCQEDNDFLWRSEEWCMAAYFELRMRRLGKS